jgi:hypothetical protein
MTEKRTTPGDALALPLLVDDVVEHLGPGAIPPAVDALARACADAWRVRKRDGANDAQAFWRALNVRVQKIIKADARAPRTLAEWLDGIGAGEPWARELHRRAVAVWRPAADALAEDEEVGLVLGCATADGVVSVALSRMDNVLVLEWYLKQMLADGNKGVMRAMGLTDEGRKAFKDALERIRANEWERERGECFGYLYDTARYFRSVESRRWVAVSAELTVEDVPLAALACIGAIDPAAKKCTGEPWPLVLIALSCMELPVGPKKAPRRASLSLIERSPHRGK